MKFDSRVVLGCVVSAMFVSCSDDSVERTPCEASSYVSACDTTLTHVYVCEDGRVVPKECPQGCDEATGKCKDSNGSATGCTEASYPAACKEGSDTIRTYCKDGQKAEETCASGQKCVAGECVTDDSCTEETYPATCKDDKTLLFCNGGRKDSKSCSGKCEGNACVDESGACVEENYQPKCLDSKSRTYCKDGKEVVETCAAGCENGECIEESTECGSDFVDSCKTPGIRKYCKDGTIAYELCKGGAICNSALKTISCRNPVSGDACDVETFSERCVGSARALTCNAETGKVEVVDCSDYGSGYKCDIAENFGGKDLDAVMCYSSREDCEESGAETYDYCYHEDESGFRSYYKNTYVCRQFNLGKHEYLASTELCPDNGKCGQSEIRQPCNFE